MASHMVVPPSRDTLFFRGFSGRRDIQDIRDYFERQAGCSCTIEFFKLDEMNDQLYLALKFESREIAKDIYNRFDDTEVMGDRIELSWFKDLRKAKQQQALDRQQRYGNMGYGNYNRRYQPFHRRSPMGGRRYLRSRDRTYSRSASRSRSRTRSLSGSPRRSRSEKRNPRDSSSSRSSSPEASKGSKLRSKVQPSDKQDESSPSKKINLEDIKPPNSPDDRSPGRQSARSQDVKPSPQIRRDHSEERKVSRLSVDDQRSGVTAGSVGKREDDRYSRASGDDGVLNRSQQEERLSRLEDQKSRVADDAEEKRVMLLEQQRLRQRQDIEKDDLRRRDPMLEAQDVSERRRAGANSLRALSPSMQLDERPPKPDEDRLKSSTMFWDDLDEPRGAKSAKGLAGKDRLSEGLRGSVRGGGLLDDDDIPSRDRPPLRGLDDDDRFYGMMERRGGLTRSVRDLDFSQDAMALVQEKKKEIERVYKNDCETFITVVKMLISKEPSLEERLLYSLRENLKEIGQRCILDLREYMDRLREHDK